MAPRDRRRYPLIIPRKKVAERVPALHRIGRGLTNGAEGPSPLPSDNIPREKEVERVPAAPRTAINF